MRRTEPLRPAAGALLLAALTLSCTDGTGPDFDTLVITTETLPVALVGEPYAAGINAEGGDAAYEWELTQGSLPAGLVLTVEGLTDDDALIEGTPERPDTVTLTLQVRSGDGQTATRQLTLEVVPEPIENVALPPALVGYAYDIPLRTPLDGPVQWQIEGTLPPGLTFADGRISGTPTATDTAEIVVRLVTEELTAEEQFDIRVARDRPEDYHITPFEVVDVPPGIRPHLDAAIEKWERVLTSDFEVGEIPAGAFGANVCGGFGEDVNGTAIDDLLLLVNIHSIDGPGKVLGRAGPCLFRDSAYASGADLPGAGILTLDLDDLEPAIGTDALTSTIAHEIGHVLGFGGLWPSRELLEGSDTDDPVFTGELAVEEWHAVGGTGPVPVHAGGGEGTELAHWRESVFRSELMSPFLQTNVSNPLSRVSVASLADLGYGVDLSAADPWVLTLTLRAEGEATESILGYDELYDGPVGTIERR